jgi:hypothetical protein
MEKKGFGYMEKGDIYGYMGLASFVEVLDRYHILSLLLMYFYISVPSVLRSLSTKLCLYLYPPFPLFKIQSRGMAPC